MLGSLKTSKQSKIHPTSTAGANGNIHPNDPRDDPHKHLIYTTLTYNSFTLYTYENPALLDKLLSKGRTINCVDIISSQLSNINNPNAFTIGIIPVSSITNLSESTRRAVQSNSLTLYYIKYQFDNSEDLVTIVTICSSRLKKEIPLIILDHILASYKLFRAAKAQDLQQQQQQQQQQNSDTNSSTYGSISNGKKSIINTNTQQNNNYNVFGDVEFKSEFANLIISEEKKISSLPSQLVLTSPSTDASDSQALLSGRTSTSQDSYSNSAVNLNNNADLSNLNITFMTSELNDLKQIMNDNVDKIMDRNERIGLLVNKTDRINLNSATFKRRTLQLKRKLWWNNIRFRSMIALVLVLVSYFTIGELGCGLPFYKNCLSHDKPSPQN